MLQFDCIADACEIHTGHNLLIDYLNETAAMNKTDTSKNKSVQFSVKNI